MSDLNDPNNQAGQIVAKMVQPYPPTPAPEPAYFKMSIPNAAMHRPDGKRITFPFGTFKATLLHDIKYLRDEIVNGHPHLTEAGPEDVKKYEALVNPREAMKKELLNDPDVRAELEAQIRYEMANKDVGATEGIVVDREEVKTDSDQSGGTDQSGDMLSGTDAKLSALRAGIKSGTGTLIPTATDVGTAQTQGVSTDTMGTTDSKAPLGGIVNSGSVSTNAPLSGK